MNKIKDAKVFQGTWCDDCPHLINPTDDEFFDGTAFTCDILGDCLKHSRGRFERFLAHSEHSSVFGLVVECRHARFRI